MKKIIRYIGSKEKLMPFLDENIFKKYKNKKINFLDAFSGTTVISKYLQENYAFNLYLSDFSNYTEILSSRLFINLCSENILYHIRYIFDISNSLKKNEKGVIFEEFSIGGTPFNLDIVLLENQEHKSRMFFSSDVGIKIDTMRTYIKDNYECNKLNKYDKNILLMLMIGFADKNANTTSVYGAYLKNQYNKTKGLSEEFFNLLKKELNSNIKNPKKFFKGDILDTLEKIPNMDVIYFDPPYNTRKYESNYHILNYLTDLNFKKEYIKENSKTGLPLNKIKNSFGTKKETKNIFNDMIVKGIEKSENIFISYSTDGEMKQEQINQICLDNKLSIQTYTQDYKKYKSKNNNKHNDLKEIIYHIKRN